MTDVSTEEFTSNRHVATSGAKVRRRPSLAVTIGLAILVLYVFVAVFAPVLAPQNPLKQDTLNRLASPSGGHLLGTDELGRDVLSRLIYATRTDLPIGVLAALLPAVLGTLIGVVAGYRGGWLDGFVMRVADLFQAFPSYVLVIVLVFALGQGTASILIAFTLLGWLVYARLIRSEVLRVRESGYVLAAQLAGVPTWRIVLFHVLPNVIPQTLVYLPSDIVFATLALASFSFLGLGVPPPTPEWGAMIAEGQRHLRDQWWLSTVPGIVIMVFGVGLSLVGEWLEERL
ncbi:MAG: ABC transporter permease [Microthrixaceae bacterium]